MKKPAIPFIDIANFSSAFLYSGMKPLGIDVDPICLGYLFGASVAISGMYQALGAVGHNAKAGNNLEKILKSSPVVNTLGRNRFNAWKKAYPLEEGISGALFRAVACVFEMGVGYGIPYIAYKVIT